MQKNHSKPIKATLTIHLPFESKHIAESIYKATNPENQETPSGILSKATVDNNIIKCTIQSTTGLWHLITTVEDFFDKVDTSRKVIKKIQKR
jgi:tRNA threonylcarbamoyladenosine modification (KEOPS) complex  Pcc1 subunit